MQIDLFYFVMESDKNVGSVLFWNLENLCQNNHLFNFVVGIKSGFPLSIEFTIFFLSWSVKMKNSCAMNTFWENSFHIYIYIFFFYQHIFFCFKYKVRITTSFSSYIIFNFLTKMFIDCFFILKFIFHTC